MFTFALQVGVYSYIIFAIGIFGLASKNLIIWFTLVFLGIAFYWSWRSLFKTIRHIIHIGKVKSKLLVLLALIFALQVGINLIGALGPELAFDALWYHLTLPKLYLQNHSIFFIPGGLLYYSAMPKLGEMFYVAGLAFGNEIWTKVIHLSFGLLTSLALYKLQRKFFSPLISIIGVVIFYANLVVAWESITSYIDLIRTFFEIMALWAFINWWESNKRKWFVLSAIMVGLAITTKLLAAGSLLIFSVIIIFFELKKLLSRPRIHNTLYIILNTILQVFVYLVIALAVPIPWFIFSYINTGNPIYPFFTQIYKVTPEPLSVLGFLREFWNLFTSSPDPLSPLYMIFFPIIVFSFSKFKPEIKIISLYSILTITVWFFTPRTGGGRFILPYLPAFSIVCAACVSFFMENRKRYGVYIAKFLIILIIFVSLITTGYRFIANSKYIPVLLGKKTSNEFLSNNLNFSFGDFYDTDKYFESNITQKDKVLLLGFHNLYYVNFPFVDASWVTKGERFNYIAVQNMNLPSQYNNWNLIYINPETHVKLFSLGGGKWEYWKN
jgi:hypothetical protein